MHQIIFFVEKFSKEDLVWNPKFYKNAEINIKKVKSTINDLDFNYNKIMVCGRGTDSHPNFHPRFSTTSADIESELHVLVDHTFLHKEYIKRNGNYALSLIVHQDNAYCQGSAVPFPMTRARPYPDNGSPSRCCLPEAAGNQARRRNWCTPFP